jgi:hypothetical protein
MRPTDVECRSSLNLAGVELQKSNGATSATERITDPETRRRLTADLAAVKKQLSDLLDRHAVPDGLGGFKLSSGLAPWLARQRLAEITELQELGQELEALLGHE